MKMLIDPPENVQFAIRDALAACRGWQPTEIPFSPIPLSPDQIQVVKTAEAQICSIILEDPAISVQHHRVIFELGTVAALAAVLIIWISGLHRLPVALWRLGRRLVARASA